MSNVYLNSLENPLLAWDAHEPGPSQTATVVTDDERILRITFQEDPKKGCDLLFRRYYINLCNQAVRFVHSKEIAEDIVSEVFTDFWQKGIYEQITTSYRAYLYKSIRHRSYNYLKWQLNKTVPLDSEGFSIVSETLSPDDILQYSELHHQVELIVQKLPPQCRRAYILKRVEGKKYDEIATELGISAKAVEALVSRGLARLRSGLRENRFLEVLIFFCMPF
ncbi:RNA polymerase sigma-70 factor [Dyadobacter sp. CY343]|uniref:RNA polymerase sigma-70 factor n=1 Tax=Dyadobacter sp. CY343 TaxID=2907299 RepID=UPI001F3B70CF|nr:RNA polymerase sigma-70 factor [Dyadobacter sp. CY343]MCE7059365.1 RNA polymerase sigma-70 factor [Dyadobacter sp. CY343]